MDETRRVRKIGKVRQSSTNLFKILLKWGTSLYFLITTANCPLIFSITRTYMLENGVSPILKKVAFNVHIEGVIKQRNHIFFTNKRCFLPPLTA